MSTPKHVTTSSSEPPETAILSIWVPAFVFAHVFAGFWLIKAVFVMNPGWLRAFKLTRGSKGAADGSGDKTLDDDEGQARTTSLDQRVLAEVAEAAEAVSAARYSANGNAVATELLNRHLPTATGARLVSSSGGGAAQGRSSTGSGRMSVIEVMPVELEWRKLSCSYHTNGGVKWVLEDVYGLAQPGEMQVG